MSTGLEFHEVADIFPLDEQHLDALAEDVRRRGLEEPIKLFGGKILDGRRRYLACQRAGVTPTYQEVRPDDPIDYVFSLNFHRRHLTPTQASMAAAKATALRQKYAQQAKERQREAGKVHGRGKEKVPVNLPEPMAGDTRDQLGQKFGVSGKSVDFASKVLAKGTPALIAAVEADHIAVSTAARVASRPDEEQNALAERARRAASQGQRRTRPAAANDLPELTEAEKEHARRVKAVGLVRAHEAINCLSRIPQDDFFRKRGFQIVADWLRRQK
jgi:hypothetical protein